MASLLWQRLRAARKSSGLTQADLANRLGVTRAAVSQWEHHDHEKRSQPRWEHIAAAAIATGIPQSWLASDDVDVDSLLMGGGTASNDPSIGAWTAYAITTEFAVGAKASAPPGGQVAYRRKWLESHGLRTSELVTYTVRAPLGYVTSRPEHGSASQHAVQPGDVLLIDTHCRALDREGIYLVGDSPLVVVIGSRVDPETLSSTLGVVAIEGAARLPPEPISPQTGWPIHGKAVVRTTAT